MAFEPLKAQLWQQQHAVLLHTLDARYQPLRCLSLDKYNGKLCAAVASETPLVYFDNCKKQPTLCEGSVQQEVTSVFKLDVTAGAQVDLKKAAAGLFAGLAKDTSSTLQLCSESVYEHDLMKWISDSTTSEAWKDELKWAVMNKAPDSWFSRFACWRMPPVEETAVKTFKFGVITEVLYAVLVQTSSTSTIEVDAEGKVAGVLGKVGLRLVKQTDGTIKTNYYAPLAYKFWLVTWHPKANRWIVHKVPNVVPDVKGTAAPVENMLEHTPDQGDITLMHEAPPSEPAALLR